MEIFPWEEKSNRVSKRSEDLISFLQLNLSEFGQSEATGCFHLEQTPTFIAEIQLAVLPLLHLPSPPIPVTSSFPCPNSYFWHREAKANLSSFKKSNSNLNQQSQALTARWQMSQTCGPGLPSPGKNTHGDFSV